MTPRIKVYEKIINLLKDSIDNYSGVYIAIVLNKIDYELMQAKPIMELLCEFTLLEIDDNEEPRLMDQNKEVIYNNKIMLKSKMRDQKIDEILND